MLSTPPPLTLHPITLFLTQISLYEHLSLHFNGINSPNMASYLIQLDPTYKHDDGS
jgi:hypothetical protein